MDKYKYLTEKLNSIRNEMSHIWGGIFVTGGGIFTLAVTTFTPLKLTLVILGLFLTILFINGYFLRRNELLYILRQMEEENK